MTSGIRKLPPISTSSPRDTTASLPADKAAKASIVAPALLFTTADASPPNNCSSFFSTASTRLDRFPVSKLSSTLEYPCPASAIASTACWASGARPNPVWRMMPVALIQLCSGERVNDLTCLQISRVSFCTSTSCSS